jgi:hypothetical protein
MRFSSPLVTNPTEKTKTKIAPNKTARNPLPSRPHSALLQSGSPHSFLPGSGLNPCHGDRENNTTLVQMTVSVRVLLRAQGSRNFRDETDQREASACWSRDKENPWVGGRRDLPGAPKATGKGTRKGLSAKLVHMVPNPTHRTSPGIQHPREGG